MRTIFILLLLVSPCLAGEERFVPLEDIWARDMPGTKEVFNLEEPGGNYSSPHEWFDNSSVLQIGKALFKYAVTPSDSPGEVFLVPGEGKTALRHAHAVLAKKEAFPNITADSFVSLVFYAWPTSGSYLRIVSVEVTSGLITVRYQPVIQTVHDHGPRFALVPIGKLSEGPVKIEVIEDLPATINGPIKDSTFSTKKFVCQSNTVMVLPGTTGRTIPLSDIWAYGMPWTKNIRDLDPLANVQPHDPETFSTSSFSQILESLNHPDGLKGGFVVVGNREKALQSAKDVLCGTIPPRSSFPSGRDLTLVFFSRIGSKYVRLESVLDRGEEIQIVCRGTAHSSTDATRNLALIPLGKRKPGVVQVTITSAPTIDEFGQPKYPDFKSNDKVCRSFKFTVSQQEK